MIRGIILAFLVAIPPPAVQRPPRPAVLSFDEFLRTRSRQFGIPEKIVRGMISVESSGDPHAVGEIGEIGLLQVRLSTAREVLDRPTLTRRELFDPVLNIEAGLRYLAELQREFRGDLRLALLAYNRGPERVRTDLRSGRTVRGTYARRVQKAAAFKRNYLGERMNKLSVVIPSYRNSKYLRLALSSLLAGKRLPDTEIVVVVDGFREEYEDLMKEFAGKVRFVVLAKNRGMMNAINVGVYRSAGNYVLVTNEDIVAGDAWDEIVLKDCEPKTLLGIDCIEPREGSMFGFPAFNAGETIEEFRLADFHRHERSIRDAVLSVKSFIFPFAIAKAQFMSIGGFDSSNFSGPYLVDDDFFLRCKLAGLACLRTTAVRFYHFSGKSTKFRDDKLVSTDFYQVERKNAEEFVRKWTFSPARASDTNEVVAVGSCPSYLNGLVRIV